MSLTPSQVPCPACHAKPGEPCTQPTDNSRRPVRWFHMARESAALDVDTASSASRQHFIDTGRYLTFAEQSEDNTPTV